jgi:hypothetical protein
VVQAFRIAVVVGLAVVAWSVANSMCPGQRGTHAHADPGPAPNGDAPEKAPKSPDDQARATLDDLRALLIARDFSRVRAGLEAFPLKHPQASEAVTQALEKLKHDFDTQRRTWFAAEVRRRFVPTLRRLVDLRGRPKGALLDDVLEWSRKDLTEDAFAELTKALQGKDAAVKPEEARAFWDSRPKAADAWSTATYGSGSFLVAGDAGVPRDAATRKARDAWWEKADATARLDWVFASFVEKSGLFELSPRLDPVNCRACEGQGRITKTLSNRTQLTYLCSRCGGAQRDRVVKYR